MFFKEWNILVVDDDPDVLAVTKLALRNVTVYGLPVKIYTAGSKAQAIELLKGPLEMPGSTEPIVAVALVDLVLESEQAGLELCTYIREEAGGYSTQLYIRTGRPDIASERFVIDNYDVSGYFTKAELTEQKLYSLVKNGVRQWFTNWYVLMTGNSINNIIANLGSRREFMENGIGWFGVPGPQEGEGVTGFIFDGKIIASDYPEHVKPLYERLDVLKPVIQTPEGHKLAMDKMGSLLVRTVKTKSTADYIYVGESTMVMPRLLLDLTFKSGLAFSTLWKKITDAEKDAKKKTAQKTVKSLTEKPVNNVTKDTVRKRK